MTKYWIYRKINKDGTLKIMYYQKERNDLDHEFVGTAELKPEFFGKRE